MGLKQGQLLGQHLAVAQMIYFKEYQPMPFLSGYIGAVLEYGGAYDERDDINVDNSIGSGSVFFAASSPLLRRFYADGTAAIGYWRSRQWTTQLLCQDRPPFLIDSARRICRQHPHILRFCFVKICKPDHCFWKRVTACSPWKREGMLPDAAATDSCRSHSR